MITRKVWNSFRTNVRTDFLENGALFFPVSLQVMHLTWRKTHKYPPLNEDELEEKFIRSGGPGGQNVNKLNTCVQLRHVPSGILIKCQEQRRQEDNRRLARQLMQEKLDIHVNGENSFVEQKKRILKDRQERKYLKTKRKLELLKQVREAQSSSDGAEDGAQETAGENDKKEIDIPDKKDAQEHKKDEAVDQSSQPVRQN